MISSSKREEIHQHYSNEDDCLKEAINFWMKRCPFASYQWIAHFLKKYQGISHEMRHSLELVQGKISGR